MLFIYQTVFNNSEQTLFMAAAHDLTASVHAILHSQLFITSW